MWPHLPEKIEVSGALVMRARKHDEQRCGVHAAVIFAEGHFLQGSHFALPHFMQDLAGLGFILRIDFIGLGGGQKFENSSRNGGAHPQRLEGGNDTVAAKNCAEPGYACVGISPLTIAESHHVEIGKRALGPVIEAAVGAGNLAQTVRSCLQFRVCARESTGEAHPVPLWRMRVVLYRSRNR